jgi:hypothetical protein
MEDDLIASLTRQVQAEVIENYLAERRLVEYQIEDLQKQAEELRHLAKKTGKRLSRLAFLMFQDEMVARLIDLLHIEKESFWAGCLQRKSPHGVRFIRVRALTEKGKFKKLLQEAYSRLVQWMEKYARGFEELRAECNAINSNIKKFQGNFDLLTILNFLKSLDTVALERKQFLGENFSAQEISSVDQKLSFHQVPFEKLDVPSPLPLPKPEQMEGLLGTLAQEVYSRQQRVISNVLQ